MRLFCRRLSWSCLGSRFCLRLGLWRGPQRSLRLPTFATYLGESLYHCRCEGSARAYNPHRFTVAGYYLPSIVALNDANLDLSLKFTYRSYFAIYAPGIIGVLLGVLCYDLPGFGRKWTMVVSSGLMAASLFIWTTVNSEASNIGLNCMEYFFQSMYVLNTTGLNLEREKLSLTVGRFNAVLYGFTPEVFPAPIRGTASGFNSFLGRLFGIIGPIVSAGLLPAVPTVQDYNKALYLAGGESQVRGHSSTNGN